MPIRGPDVFVHWTVLCIVAIMLAGTLRNPAITFVALCSYLGVLLLHESGYKLLDEQISFFRRIIEGAWSREMLRSMKKLRHAGKCITIWWMGS